MAPKKKAEAAAAGDAPDDETVNNFYKFYKRNCNALATESSKTIKEAYEVGYIEEQMEIKKLHLWDPIGWQGT